MVTIAELPSHQIRKLDLVVALAAGVAVALVLSFQNTERWPFEDTANYLSVARCILNGDGLKTDVVYYPEQASFQTFPAPQTVFPPGYSLAVAAVAKGSGLSVEDSAQVLSLVSYACIAPLLFCFAFLAGLQRTLSYTVLALWLSTAAFWVFTCSVASEAVFVLLTLFAVVCCSASENRRWLLLVAGTSAAFAFSVRYVGVFLAITLGLAILIHHGFHIRRMLRSAVLLLSPGALMMAILFVRNHLLIGSWKGGNNYESQSFVDVLVIFYYAVCRIVGFSKTSLLQGELVSVGLVAGFVLLAVMLLKQWSFRGLRSFSRTRDLRQITILLYGPVSIAFLFYLDITSNSGMTSRLLLPTIPFFLVTLGLIVQQAISSDGWNRRLAMFASVMLIASFLAGQRISLAEFHNDARIGRAVERTLQQEVASGETLLNLLRRIVTKKSALLSCHPQFTSLYLQRPVLGLPTDYFNTLRNDWTPETTRQYIKGFPVQYVLLLTDVELTNDAEFFEQLNSGEAPDWLQQKASGKGFRLFEVVNRSPLVELPVIRKERQRVKDPGSEELS